MSPLSLSYPSVVTELRVIPKFFNFSSSTADLQCCISLWWFSFIYIHTHTHTHFFKFFSIIGNYMWLTYFTFRSLHLLIPNSYVTPPPNFPWGIREFIFYVRESVSVLWISSLVSFLDSIIFSIISVFLWLASLNMIISRSIRAAANGIISFFF